MKKRVGLARAIAHEPEYILYDEPTTGLDPIMSDVINDLILGVQQKLGVTSVVVTHDMKSAYKISNRIAMLYQGRVVTVGTPQEIQASANPLVKQFITGSSHGPIEMPVRAHV
jgi:phospholipid/cholesterol/gamma-HCH transport system ATP-binding protein